MPIISFKFKNNSPGGTTWAFLLVILLPFAIGCKKYTEVDPPPTSLTSDNVYQNDATANSVLIGLYAALSSSSPTRGKSFNSITLIAALSADELMLHGGGANANYNLTPYYLNNLSSGFSDNSDVTIWKDCYAKLYIINLALERLSVSSNLTPAIKKQLTGEAKFLRAFLYFYLTNLYGDVPLALSSDYRINSNISRSPKATVYNQMVMDLIDAEDLLKESYVSSDGFTNSSERLRPNKYAAAALLARVYLYSNDWVNAEVEASKVINSTATYNLTDLDNVFLKNSKEAIWQLQPVNIGWNTEDARIFIIPSTGPTSNVTGEGYPVYLSSQLLNSFEPGDQRKLKWVGRVTVSGPGGAITYYFPYKYKSASLNAPVTEYEMMFRIGEQYLIRAESRAQLGKLNEALSDLNIIRTRAGLGVANASNKSILLDMIQHERQVELFTEWGHRWMDLKRSGRIDQVMTPVAITKGTQWNPNWALYPLPLYDIIRNPNLTQNPGYR